MKRISIMLLALLVLAAMALAQDAPKADSVAITVYNDNLGVVKDVRTVTLAKGVSMLEFSDVAALVEASSVKLTDVADWTALNVLEQNFQYDLVSPGKLLEKYLGKEIALKVYDEAGKLVRVDNGTLLSINGDRPGVMNIGGKIVINAPGTVELPALSEGLRIKPTLEWLLDSRVEGSRQVEITYCTGGISWRADYVLLINETDTQGSLNGWVTLTNNSGATYKNATLKLVAGTINRAQPERQMYRNARSLDLAMAAPAGMGGFEEESFFEYHLYSLQRPTTVSDREIKQVALLDAPSFGLDKVFLCESNVGYSTNPEQPDKVKVKLKFDNAEANGLGMPLPAGIVKLYKKDSSGSSQLIGEDRIQHTPKNETIWLTVGEAFDVTSVKTLMARRDYPGNLQQFDGKFVLKNHKAEAIKVTVRERFWGDWRIQKQSQEGSKKGADYQEWIVDVPADGEATLTYTVEVGERPAGT